MKISEITTVVTGGTPSTKNKEFWENGTIPWLQSGVCKNGYVDACSKYITQAGLNNSSAKMMPAGTVIIALTGATVGKVGLMRIDACANQSVTGIIPCDSFLPLYMFYYLMRIRGKIIHDSYGDAQPHISQQYVKDIDIPLPSISEQQRIVSRIEEFFSFLDNAVETLQKTKEQLAVYRQAVLKEAFDSAEKDCKMLPISELLTKSRKGMSTGPFGTMIKKIDHREFGVPMLGIENIGKGKFVDGNKIFVTPEKAEELKAFSLKAGDIIISRSGTVGEICAVPEKAEGALMSTNLMRISLDNSIIQSDYFIALFQSKGIVLDQIRELCKGSTRDFLNQTILKQILFPVPSKEKQIEIVSIIEARMSLCESIEQTVNIALVQAEAMRQSILNEAFEGRLV